MNESDKRVIALQAALDLAESNRIDDSATGVGVRFWTPVEVKNAAELFFIFLAPEYLAAQNKPKIGVAWRDETPDVVAFARQGAPLPATHGAAPLVSTTVVKAAKAPESLREMRARAESEREAAELLRKLQSTGDHAPKYDETEKF